MKLRVAVTATLLNLLVCVLLLVSFTISAGNNQNDLIEEELKVTCRLSKEILDSAAFMDREGYLGVLSDREDMAGLLIAYLLDDGTVAYKSFDFDMPESHLEMLKANAGNEVQALAFRGFKNVRRICAYCRLSDGSIITYAKAAASGLSMAGKSVLKLTPIMLLVLALQFIIIMNSVGRADNLIRELMNVMEDFTEGRFSSRISNVVGFSPELTAQYNQTLSRVQDRVFRQVRRNMVVGQMLNQMHNGLITVDTDLNVTFANINAGKLFGKDIKDAEGRPFMDVFGNEDAYKLISEAIQKNTTNVLTTLTDGGVENGSTRPLKLYTSIMSSSTKCTGAMVVVEDITELRRLEQLRTDLAANVSHELRTPLTSIQMSIESMRANPDLPEEKRQKLMDIFAFEVERMIRLVNDILTITKMESGNDEVEIQRLNLLGVIRRAVDSLSAQAANAGVSLKVHHADEAVWIDGNADRVTQVIVNLLSNGIKYNKPGGDVTVTVMQDKTEVHMIVADTGIGIKEEDLGRLFERFYRVDKGRSRQAGGTGLGLAICKHIVKTMGGYIEVHSKYGEGTEFLVTLPRADAQDHTDASDDAKENT